MKAGIDIGTTLMKAAWMDKTGYRFASSADTFIEDITRQLHDEGIRKVHLAGIGPFDAYAEHFDGFKIHRTQGDPIQNEIILQADGARRLLQGEGYRGKRFLLVSVGTGTSYTIVTEQGTARFPIGNSLGGGFIHGLGKLLGAADYDAVADSSADASSLDLRIKDMLPEKEGSFEGELVVANFGKAHKDSPAAQAYASAVSTVAVAITRDILLFGMMPHLQMPDDVVYIGSTVSRTPLLKKMLTEYSTMIGKNPLVPEHGEFSLAVGAYHKEAA